MPLFRTILVAADFSENSREAFRMACSLAHPGETRLTVLYVEEPPILSEVAVPLPPGAEERTHHEALGGQLRGFYVPDRPLRVDYRTQDGLAVDEILRVSDELGATLIVLGTHGRTGVGRLLAGSVAEAVLRRAQCPVLALRSPSHLAGPPGAGDEDTNTRSIRTILHPTDFSAPSEGAFCVACSLAREHGARLIVVLAAPMATVYGGMFLGIPTGPGPYQHALEERLCQIRPPDTEAEVEPGSGGAGLAQVERPHGKVTSAPDIMVEHRLREGDAAMEILRVADDVGADLIVMATHGRTGMARVLMGSVAEAILRGSRCPVLVVKGPIPNTTAVVTTPVPANASD